MKQDFNSLLAINKYLTCCKNDKKQVIKARKYLSYKLEKILNRDKKPTKYFFLFGIPINLFSFL